jgi:GGDEF domain-containing protein
LGNSFVGSARLSPEPLLPRCCGGARTARERPESEPASSKGRLQRSDGKSHLQFTGRYHRISEIRRTRRILKQREQRAKDMRLTLRQQIFFGYILMVTFTLIVGIYAIWGLTELNQVTSEIIFTDMAVGEKISKLNDCIQAQDLYEQRFLAFGQPDSENLFWSRSRDFKALLSEIGSAQPALKNSLDGIVSQHDGYDQLFAKEVSLIKSGDNRREVVEVSSTALKAGFNRILSSIRDIDIKNKARQNKQISRSGTLGERVLMVTIILSAVSFVFGVLFASLLTSHLTTAINRLKAATHSIRSGNFDNIPDIQGADELADLAISFKEMSVRLKELEVTNLDANPLTKLPGNLAIEKELLTRLNDTEKFSFCLVDLDNFKAFNDRYGYARGSDVIKWLAEVLSGIKKDIGTSHDFLGHIGGDDFVIICSPERVHAICNKIIEEFDRGIVNFYDPDDLKKGFIVSVDRNDNPAIFGIMTISIAVVNTDRTLIREPKEVALKVTELKQYAKTFAKSLYIMDRRRSR